MENTVESANKFISDWRDRKVNNGIAITSADDFLRMMVAYANHVRPEIVWPDDDFIKALFTTEHYSQDDGRYYKKRLDRIQGAKVIMSEFRRLNPHLSGTDKNDKI